MLTTTLRSASRFHVSFSFLASAAPKFYTLSLHDALPILLHEGVITALRGPPPFANRARRAGRSWSRACSWRKGARSEEHTSELQSRRDIVCRLLLEKKKLSAPACLAFTS